MSNAALQFAQLGAEVIKSFGDSFQVSNKGVVDLVTEADLASEKALVAAIKEAYPTHSILAEEGTNFGSLQDEFCWVVDPLDGTTNFAAGIPQVGVSVALCSKGLPIQSAIVDVFSGESFFAEKGKGAFLNNKKISVKKDSALIEAVVGTGFPYDRVENWDKYNRYFSEVCKSCRDLRRFGAASLDISWVACGRFSAFFECGLKPWDLAGGMLLVEEAGGLIGTFEGESGLVLEGQSFLCGGPRVFEELKQLLKS